MTSPVALVAAAGPVTALVAYLAAIAAAAWLGGTASVIVSAGHRRMQVLLSLTGGVMLGVGLLHLLPHACHAFGGAIETTMPWVLGGFCAMFLLERAFHGHAHHAADGTHDSGCRHHDDHDHDHAHVHVPADQRPAPGPRAARWSWVGALVGLTLHSLADGAALAAAVQAGGAEGGGLVGFAAFLAIVAHKPIDACVITTLMVKAGASAGTRSLVTAAYALVVPAGALAYVVSVRSWGGDHASVNAAALALAAGAFLCIAAADLLPEVEFHSHDRVLLTAALGLGLLVALAITAVEHASPAHAAHAGGHAHRHDP